MIPDNTKNIIFDLGGVILNIDYNLTINQFKKLGISNFEKVYSQAQQTNIFDLFETGNLSEKEFIEKIQQLNPKTILKEDIINAWNAMLLDLPIFRKETLKKYAEKYSIVLLSNTNETHVKAFKKIITDTYGNYWFPKIFQNVYYSNEIGLRKPNADAFQFVLEENNFKPSETVFFDDSIQHIDGAQKCGINAIHLKNETIEDYL